MNSINKYQTLIIGFAVLFGLLIGQNALIGNYTEYFIVPFFGFGIINFNASTKDN